MAPKCSCLEMGVESYYFILFIFSTFWVPPCHGVRIAQHLEDVTLPSTCLTSSSPGADTFTSGHLISKTPPFPFLHLPSVPTDQLPSICAPGTGNLGRVKLAVLACGFPSLPLSPIPGCVILAWSQSAATFPTLNFFPAIFLVLRLLLYLAIVASCPGS